MIGSMGTNGFPEDDVEARSGLDGTRLPANGKDQHEAPSTRMVVTPFSAHQLPWIASANLERYVKGKVKR